MKKGVDQFFYDERGMMFDNRLEARESDLFNHLMELFSRMPHQNIMYSLIFDRSMRAELRRLIQKAKSLQAEMLDADIKRYHRDHLVPSARDNRAASVVTCPSCGHKGHLIEDAKRTTQHVQEILCPSCGGVIEKIRSGGPVVTFVSYRTVDGVAPVCSSCEKPMRILLGKNGHFLGCGSKCGDTYKL